MGKEYLSIDGKLIRADGKLVSIPDAENLNDLADTNNALATQSDEVANEIENIIVKSGVINGSPKGVYASLKALKTAYPSGANGVYVTSDNGHWYYWNGTAWTDGGAYRNSENIVQETGTATDKVMSQKAVTEAIALNRFAVFLSLDTTTGVYTSSSPKGLFDSDGSLLYKENIVLDAFYGLTPSVGGSVPTFNKLFSIVLPCIIGGTNEYYASGYFLNSEGDTASDATIASVILKSTGCTISISKCSLPPSTNKVSDGKVLTVKNGKPSWEVPSGGSGGGSGDETYTNSTPTPVAIGGIAKGSTFEGKTMKEMWDALLYPYVAPSNLSYTANAINGVFEKGTSVTLTSISYSFTKNSGTPVSLVLKGFGDDITIATGSSMATSGTYSLSKTVNASMRSRLVLTYDTGNTLSSNVIVTSFIDPYFYGVGASDVSITTLSKIVSTKSSKTLSFSPSNQYIYFAYPASYGDLKSIKDSNGFENIGGFTKTVETLEVASDNVSYNIYKSNEPSTATGFKLTFSY